MKFSKKEKLKAATPVTREWEFINKSPLSIEAERVRELDSELNSLRRRTTGIVYNTTSNLIPPSIQYDLNLRELVTLCKGLDNSGHSWDIQSSFISNTYEKGSINCYLSLDNSKLKREVLKVGDSIFSVVTKVLSSSGKRVKRDPILFCCDWLAHHICRAVQNKADGLRYYRSNETYLTAIRVNKGLGVDSKLRVPTCKTLMKCIDILIEEGYAHTFKGYKNSNFDKTTTSLLLPTSKLTDLVEITDEEHSSSKERLLDKLVDIRGSNKKSILKDFYKQEWLVDITKSREILKKHNQLIIDTDIRVDETPLEGLQVMRIHNEGSPAYGGRLYDEGTWTTMRKVNRKEVKIKGEETVTIDLSHLHPSLLYAKKGINIEGFDPYSGVEIFTDPELIQKFKDYYNIDHYDPIRNLVKLGLLIMINAKSEQEASYAIDKKISRNFAKGGTILENEMSFVGLPWKCGAIIVPQIKEHNKGIAEFFCTGISKELMRVDSDIILETLDRLVDVGICSLPLHDSITVAKSDALEAEKHLHEAYKAIVGTDLNYSVKFE